MKIRLGGKNRGSESLSQRFVPLGVFMYGWGSLSPLWRLVKRFLTTVLVLCYLGLLLWGLTLYHVIQWNIHVTRK